MNGCSKNKENIPIGIPGKPKEKASNKAS